LPDPRLLVIGARGFLGEHLCRVACGRFRVFRGSRAAPEIPSDVQIDIANSHSVGAAFARVSPEVVVHLAAISDIDLCERQPEVAEIVNVHGALHVAQACARAGARLVFVSSAAVFDGSCHGYSEDQPVSPIGVYGRTKARAESIVASVLDCAIVARVSLALGFASGRGSNSLLNRLASHWKTGRPVEIPDYEFRNPIDAPTLSRFLLELSRCPRAGGIYHLGASESQSRYTIALRLAERMGFSRDLVKAQDTAPPGRAPRGRDHFLLTGKVRGVCQSPVPNLAQVLERALGGIS
jgi:dTDP-4-dehydrorhamnose reductase